jgi:release factor glutamine methyltransferase
VLDAVDQRVSGTVPVLVVDVGAGSGNIAVSLAVYSQHTYVLATDQSQDALALAAKNVHRFGLQKRISLFCGERFLPLTGKGYENRVDIVVSSNGASQTPAPGHGLHLVSSNGSLCSPADAVSDLEQSRRLAGEALDFLKPGGMLALETPIGQEMAICSMLQAIAGYDEAHLVPDLSGATRVVCAIRA